MHPQRTAMPQNSSKSLVKPLQPRARAPAAGPLRGIALAHQDFPPLHALVERLRRCLLPVRLAGVLLTGDFNAAIVQPRTLGRRRNHLLLGLPLLQALPARELEAVIAHELGHAAGAGPRRASFAARLWSWTSRRLPAAALQQLHEQEYEADRASVRVVGAQVTASALLRVSLQGEFVGAEFWPGIFRRADREPTPTLAPYALLAAALRAQGPSLAQHARLRRALAQETGERDTHPALSERLRRIGAQAFLPQPLGVSAADELLGPGAARVQQALEDEWRRNVGDWWRERHRYASEARLRLMALARRAGQPRVPEPELWERARLCEELGAREEALALYAELLQRNRLHAGARWRRAQLAGLRRAQ